MDRSVQTKTLTMFVVLAQYANPVDALIVDIPAPHINQTYYTPHAHYYAVHAEYSLSLIHI